MITPPTSPPPTPPPPMASLPGVATVAERALRQMTGERRLAPPRCMIVTSDHASFYFDTTPLSAFVDWLAALGVVDVQATDNLAGADGKPVELTGLLATGHYGTLPILLHAVTEVRVPQWPSVADLRAAADTDARLRDTAARMRTEAATEAPPAPQALSPSPTPTPTPSLAGGEPPPATVAMPAVTASAAAS